MKNLYFCAGLACLMLLSVSCTKKTVKTKERSIRVGVQKLEKRTFREQIPVQGTVKPVEHATISAKISGTLEMLNVSEGDRRKTGDILFGIDRQVLLNQVVVKEDEINVKEAALKSAELQLKTEEISLQQAKRDYERALTLSRSNALSQSNLETTETAYKKPRWKSRTPTAPLSTPKPSSSRPRAILPLPRKISMTP